MLLCLIMQENKHKEAMQIERTEDEIIIRLPASTDISGVQRLLDLLKYRTTVAKSKASQLQIDELAREAKREWWEQNKDWFLA